MGRFSSLLVAALAIAACSRPPEPRPSRSSPAAAPGPTSYALAPGYLKPRPIGAAVEGHPWITHVAIADLDRDGLRDVIACEGRLNQVGWVRQTAKNIYAETVIAEVPAPVHAQPVDFDGDGDLDLLIASMGVVFPSNQKIGAVVWLEQTAPGKFERHVIVDRVERVTDVQAADLDGDGDLDLAVAHFGYEQGRVAWMENEGGGRFTSRLLLGLSGAIHTPIGDLDGDGALDIVTVVSQEWEEVHWFANAKNRSFNGRVIHGSPNEDYGSSGLSLADVDRDGDVDVLYTNGDAFDYARPGPRPWHGVQWLENNGKGSFAFRRLGNFPGAYSPIAVDLDGDGDQDIVAVSGFNHWEKPDAISLVCFENDGRQNFTARPLAHSPTHLITVAAADMDGDGRVELVTGSFHAYAPHTRLARLTLWQR